MPGVTITFQSYYSNILQYIHCIFYDQFSIYILYSMNIHVQVILYVYPSY
eukprot:COSAG02_NODE_57_length_43668_cov_118.217196_18_plen_50_part_00